MRRPTGRRFRVAAEEWALAVSVFFSGLASGLLGMLSTIMRPMLAEMDGRDFRNFIVPSRLERTIEPSVAVLLVQ
jgi:hypothetical protein